MPKSFLNQKGSPRFSEAGVFPIILIIILTVVIAGVAGVVYQSRKEIKVRSDKTTEVTELKGTPEPTPKKEDVSLANSGRLADKPFKQSLSKEATDSSVPKFSIYPPAGWEKKPPEGNYVVEFLSSSEDKIEEGMAYFAVRPNITVFVLKEQFKDLDEAVGVIDKNKSSQTVNQKQKVKISGEEAYVIESLRDIRDLAKSSLGSLIEEELAKAAKEGINVTQTDIQKDIDKVLQQTKIRILTYTFYKDGYFIRVAGKAYDSFWDKRSSQLKRSMDTFKFE